MINSKAKNEPVNEEVPVKTQSPILPFSTKPY